MFAIFDSVSKITDSFSRVGVAISDDEYIKARSRMQQYKAKHIGEGINYPPYLHLAQIMRI